MIRCEICDHPLATDAELDGCPGGCGCDWCSALCWRSYNLVCSFAPVDWRARALAAETESARLREALPGINA